MARRQITDKEREDAMSRGHKEGALRYPGQAISVQVDELTDERGNVIYKVLPAEDRR